MRGKQSTTVPGASPVVFVVDDDPKLLRLVAQVLGAEGFIVETYVRGSDFLDKYQADRRGCLLLDIQMPDLSGPEMQRELLARQIDLPIVFLTATADVPTTVTIMKRGAADVVQKPFDTDRLVAAVRNAIARDARVFQERQQREEVGRRLAQLTPREREVMDLVVAGCANKQIAQRLKLSEKTVEIHRGHMMKKMAAGSVAELVHQSVIAAGGGVGRPS
jgi:two-component system, LuxR family, response regulator FixJ